MFKLENPHRKTIEGLYDPDRAIEVACSAIRGDSWQEGGEAYLKAVIDWLDSQCPHVSTWHRHYCAQCWQELKDAIIE